MQTATAYLKDKRLALICGEIKYDEIFHNAASIVLRLNLSQLNVRLTSNAPPPSPALPCWALVDGNDGGMLMLDFSSWPSLGLA